MFFILRRIFKIAFVLFLFLLVAGFFTNPTLEDFQKLSEQQLNKEMKARLNDPTLKDIASESTTFVADILQKFVTRKNFYVCSIFELKLPVGTYYYLGAYHQFYPLQDNSPMDFVKAGEDKGGK
ncbi:MAG: DUF4359 domain-containing protein [Crocinitomicaceae bacterium]|nr:DUF4359 domain-containing protein [Crocinitomicaceae bacterium]